MKKITFCILANLVLFASAAPVESSSWESLQEDAVNLHNRGRYASAINAGRRALRQAKEHYGERAVQVAESSKMLARSYLAADDFSKAQDFYRQTLAIQEASEGGNNAAFSDTLLEVADMYTYSKQLYEAQELYERALNIRKSIYGADHPSVAEVMMKLAILYSATDQLDEAAVYVEKALSINKKATNDKLKNVVLAQNVVILARISMRQGKLDLNRSLTKRALSLLEDEYDSPSPALVADTLMMLADVSVELDQPQDARALYQRALSIQERALGPDHPIVVKTLLAIIKLHIKQNEHGKAEVILKRVLAIQKVALGDTHPDVMKTAVQLQRISAKQGRMTRYDFMTMKSAEPKSNNRLRSREESPASSLKDQQVPFEKISKDADASEESSRAKRYSANRHEKRLWKVDDLLVMAESFSQQAAEYTSKGKYTEAEALFDRSLDIYERIKGADHVDLIPILEEYVECLKLSGKTSKENSIAERIRYIRSRSPLNSDKTLR